VGKKVKVVFDTNVWISISMNKILRDEFFRVKQNIIVYISSEIISEISKVLLYPKIAATLGKANTIDKEALRHIKANSITVKPKIKVNIIKEDLEDNKILECALTAGADFIVSGDKHLQELGNYKKTKILTPREFFDEITA
jgi:putative PIN family toxin of toxin-antitoxin system